MKKRLIEDYEDEEAVRAIVDDRIRMKIDRLITIGFLLAVFSLMVYGVYHAVDMNMDQYCFDSCNAPIKYYVFEKKHVLEPDVFDCYKHCYGDKR